MKGQALVFFALVLPLVLLPVAAFSAEAGVLAARQAHLSEAVAQAALDAAQQLGVKALRAGAGWLLDVRAAQDIARAELAASEPAAVLDGVGAAGAQVTVSAHEVVPLRLAAFVGRPSATLRVRISARLTPGYASPSSLRPLLSRTFSMT
ncbi:MAG TPA: hypothetical protein VF160_12300 [Candidatus Dormibacteraeota bacterium]